MVVAVLLLMFVATRSTNIEDDSLAGQMERWTRCLRSEGAPVPLVETLEDNGFRITVDDSVLDAGFDHEALGVAFDLCLDEAPESVQTIAATIDGLSSLPFSLGDLGMLGPLLFDLGGTDMFLGPEMEPSPFGDPPIDELCAQLSELELILPDVALELLEVCDPEPDV
jgi:hypothetical protein